MPQQDGQHERQAKDAERTRKRDCAVDGEITGKRKIRLRFAAIPQRVLLAMALDGFLDVVGVGC